MIRTKAARKCPKQTQILELCKYFISEMTPLLCEAVKAGTMRADLALDAMSDLLNSWLGRNCKDGDEKYPLKQNVEGSDEWSEFEKAIAEAEEKRKGMASASVESTNAIVPTSLGVQQKEKGAESEPEAAIGALGRPASNRKKIRKSKSAEGGPRWSAEFQSNLRSETWLTPRVKELSSIRSFGLSSI